MANTIFELGGSTGDGLNLITPPVIRDDREIHAMNAALFALIQQTASTARQANILTRFTLSADPAGDPVSEAVLDELAWSIRLNELHLWTLLPVDSKRIALENYPKLMKCSGTRYTMRRVFSALNVTATIIAWWEEAATNHTYRVVVTDYSHASVAGGAPVVEAAIREWMYRFSPARARLTSVTI